MTLASKSLCVQFIATHMLDICDSIVTPVACRLRCSMQVCIHLILERHAAPLSTCMSYSCGIANCLCTGHVVAKLEQIG